MPLQQQFAACCCGSWGPYAAALAVTRQAAAAPAESAAPGAACAACAAGVRLGGAAAAGPCTQPPHLGCKTNEARAVSDRNVVLQGSSVLMPRHVGMYCFEVFAHGAVHTLPKGNLVLCRRSQCNEAKFRLHDKSSQFLHDARYIAACCCCCCRCCWTCCCGCPTGPGPYPSVTTDSISALCFSRSCKYSRDRM